ncbi:hypothetical protein ANOM_011044 [Aspergillus nomiae NRRL 13137]|uniref:3-hydroxyacyl-CoA dehydrogenase NAD binding domain-containing protein n=1 Tax=Aspergillus nomiae NRRL (strain ATCC 15546 / NRRL 13137 / CBS 260.88 / M93) TaxID=1509407 RepID=A0A0L1INK7_ASPN3|nr:uncharacterized protein ANOM_011044 [Aspergillus nomiae NRRL 13137]KNG81077.1 hypothetical protein ANOM_011044 [Aspergillus nomiae NRRL 13137]
MSTPVVRTVGVIGTGVIGASWIALFLAKGLKVIVTDPDPDAPAKLSTFLHDAWPSFVIAGLAPEASLSNYEFNSLEGFKFRRKLLARLDQKTPPATVICSSQPGIPSELVCECNHRPGRVLIGHPTSLPHLLPIIEVTIHPETQINHAIAATGFYRSLGGMPLLVREGSIDLGGNRLRAALLGETYDLVHRGVVSVADIGIVMTGLQWAFAGPFRTNGVSTIGTCPHIW